MATITIELDDATDARLDAIGRAAGLSREAIAREALSAFVEEGSSTPFFTVEETAAIEAGLAALERGDVVSQEALRARLDEKHDR